jgi:biofilm PGA synthesis protein PgaD
MPTGRHYTIDAPELLSGSQRARDTLITGVMWFIYAYLWLPAISLGAWLLGLNFAYEVLERAGGISALQRVMVWFGVALLFIIAVVSLWSLVERSRFRDQQRRQARPCVGDQEMQAFFAVDDRTLARMRSGQCLQVSFDDQATISEVAVTVPVTSDGGPEGATSGGSRPAPGTLPRTG